MLFQDDQIRDTAELKTIQREEVETHRQEEKHVDVAVKETLATQVLNKAFFVFIYKRIHSFPHVSQATCDIYLLC